MFLFVWFSARALREFKGRKTKPLDDLIRESAKLWRSIGLLLDDVLFALACGGFSTDGMRFSRKVEFKVSEFYW